MTATRRMVGIGLLVLATQPVRSQLVLDPVAATVPVSWCDSCGDTSHGSAVVIGGTGKWLVALSAGHVFRDYPPARNRAIDVGGQRAYLLAAHAPARHVMSARDDDVAVLLLPYRDGAAYAPLASILPRPGADVAILGYPGAGPLRVVRGQSRDLSGLYLQVRGGLEAGASGGPVLNEREEVVAIQNMHDDEGLYLDTHCLTLRETCLQWLGRVPNAAPIQLAQASPMMVPSQAYVSPQPAQFFQAPRAIPILPSPSYVPRIVPFASPAATPYASDQTPTPQTPPPTQLPAPPAPRLKSLPRKILPSATPLGTASAVGAMTSDDVIVAQLKALADRMDDQAKQLATVRKLTDDTIANQAAALSAIDKRLSAMSASTPPPPPLPSAPSP